MQQFLVLTAEIPHQQYNYPCIMCSTLVYCVYDISIPYTGVGCSVWAERQKADR